MMRSFSVRPGRERGRSAADHIAECQQADEQMQPEQDDEWHRDWAGSTGHRVCRGRAGLVRA